MGVELVTVLNLRKAGRREGTKGAIGSWGEVRTAAPKKCRKINRGVGILTLRSPKALAKSVEVHDSENAGKPRTYTNRTKSAQSGGLERTAPGERNSDSQRLTAVQRFARECPQILGISARLECGRETLIKWSGGRDEIRTLGTESLVDSRKFKDLGVGGLFRQRMFDSIVCFVNATALQIKCGGCGGFLRQLSGVTGRASSDPGIRF
jgi:hypothetical protein